MDEAVAPPDDQAATAAACGEATNTAPDVAPSAPRRTICGQANWFGAHPVREHARRRIAVFQGGHDVRGQVRHHPDILVARHVDARAVHRVVKVHAIVEDEGDELEHRRENLPSP